MGLSGTYLYRPSYGASGLTEYGSFDTGLVSADSVLTSASGHISNAPVHIIGTVKATTVSATVISGANISATNVSATNYSNLPNTIASATCATNARWLDNLGASALTAADPATAYSGATLTATTITATTISAASMPDAIYVSPTGGDDTASINTAIASAVSLGKNTVVLSKGTFYLVAGSINLSSNNVKLCGKGTSHDGTFGTYIYSEYNGPAILVSGGPIVGWGLEDFLVQTTVGTAAVGIQLHSAQSGNAKNVSVVINQPSQIGIATDTVGNSSPYNTCNNVWDNVWGYASVGATNSELVKLSTGGGYTLSDTCLDTWRNLSLYMSHASQIGLHLAAADTNYFENVVTNTASVGSTGVALDYGVNNVLPCDNVFFGIDTSNCLWANVGSPNVAAGATNKVYGFQTGNAATIPSLANLDITSNDIHLAGSIYAANVSATQLTATNISATSVCATSLCAVQFQIPQTAPTKTGVSATVGTTVFCGARVVPVTISGTTFYLIAATSTAAT